VGTLAYNAETGGLLWQNLSDHSQQITAATSSPTHPRRKWSLTPYLLANAKTRRISCRTAFQETVPPSDEIAVGGGLGAQLYWFDNKGKLLETGRHIRSSAIRTLSAATGYGNGKRAFW